jgi:hypothetical protein
VFMLVASVAGAQAQGLPRLHVLSFGQHADRLTVAPNEQFHVTIRVVVAERRDRLDEIVLGDLENCVIVGDERLHAPLKGGTEFIERLTLEAQSPGIATITPAHLDAINAATGAGTRYSATEVIHVRVGAFAPFDSSFQSFMRAIRSILGFIAIAAILIAILWFALRTRRAGALQMPPVATVILQPVASVGAPRDTQLADAIHAYRMSRSTADLFALRGVLFDEAGVDRGATLSDALRVLGAGNAALRFALSAAERAAFGPSGERERGGDELLAAAEAYSARRAAKPTV